MVHIYGFQYHHSIQYLGQEDIASPYYGVDTSNGGSESRPISLSPNTKINQAIIIMLKRFYILSQNTMP